MLGHRRVCMGTVGREKTVYEPNLSFKMVLKAIMWPEIRFE